MGMEKTRVPPLNALKAFEATARNLSIKKAAEELNVTSAAVSHQIQRLEESLGVELFRRRYRSIEMTEVGQLFLPYLQEGFERIRHAIEVVRHRQGTDVLTIDVPPSFSSHWLMPRLHSFIAAHPEVDVRVSTRMRQFSKATRGYRGDVQTVLNWVTESDVVVTFGTGGYPGMVVSKLMPLYIAPLCSPQLLTGPNALRKPEDLAKHVLLHDERGTLYENDSFWSMWLRAAKVSSINDAVGPRFTHAAFAIDAAIAARGVVATTPILAAGAIKAGQLVEPFDIRVPLPGTYCVVSRPEVAASEVVAAFRAWICAEAKAVD
jgi:LysR family glycine cleavage system transcriptional activator